jgi:cytidine deaminase
LSLVSPSEIHKLNLSYRKIDAPTDVLTFAYREADFNPNDPVTDLGSILICPAIAKKQAKGFHHPFEREMAFLFIHGLLHIFGYDHHAGKKDADIMFALQNKILDTLPYDFYTNIRRLKKELLLAQQGSVDTYSHFRVGAVVVTKDGKYHRGFNIENSSYPATVCAERVALFSTYAQGYTKDDIVSLGCITDASTVGTCCGVCRQVMSELMDLSCPVYIYNKDESKSLVSTVGDLLPYSFGKDDLLS